MPEPLADTHRLILDVVDQVKPTRDAVTSKAGLLRSTE